MRLHCCVRRPIQWPEAVRSGMCPRSIGCLVPWIEYHTSSNVINFDASGKTQVIRKDQRIFCEQLRRGETLWLFLEEAHVEVHQLGRMNPQARSKFHDRRQPQILAANLILFEITEIDITLVGQFSERKFLLLSQCGQAFAKLNQDLVFVLRFH